MFLHNRRHERQAGREARKKALELRSESGTPATPGVTGPRGAVIAARQPGSANRPRGAAWLMVGLMVATRALRDRDFEQRLIVAVIVVAALARMAREGLGRSVKALVAWEDERLADWEEEQRRQRQAEASQATAS